WFLGISADWRSSPTLGNEGKSSSGERGAVDMTQTGRTFATIGRLCTVGLLVGTAGGVLLFRNLNGKPIVTTPVGNDYDPRFIIWTIDWVYHTIFERLAPFDVWNANSYFPYPNSLAFSDSLLSAQLLYAPLRLLGFSTLLALYLTMAGFCIIGAVLTDRL